MHSKLFQHNFHLDPAPEGAGGGAANPSLPATGEAAPAFDASQYVPKSEFEQIRNDYSEFRQTAEQRFQDYDSRLPKAPKPEVTEDKEPDAEDGSWDFTKPGEFNRFQKTLAQYHINHTLSERDKNQTQEQSQREYKQTIQTAQNAHYDRQDSYKLLNPDYDPFVKIGFGNEAVALAVLESDFSANIHHFLQKNVDKKIELQKLSYENPRAALRMIGRLESQFEAKTASTPSLPTAKPTRGAFGGGGAKPTQRDPLEIAKEWRNN